jgi:hypothetical protein
MVLPSPARPAPVVLKTSGDRPAFAQPSCAPTPDGHALSDRARRPRSDREQWRAAGSRGRDRRLRPGEHGIDGSIVDAGKIFASVRVLPLPYQIDRDGAPGGAVCWSARMPSAECATQVVGRQCAVEFAARRGRLSAHGWVCEYPSWRRGGRVRHRSTARHRRR